MEYRVIRHEQSDDYMEHGLGDTAKNVYNKAKSAVGSAYRRGRQKGVELKNHAYKARAWIGNKWRYAYTEAEVAAMKGWGKGRQAAKTIKNEAATAYRKGRQAAKDVKNVVSGNYAKEVRGREEGAKRMHNYGNELVGKGNPALGIKVRKGATGSLERAQKEKQSLKYKISDILGSGLHSETLQPYVTKGKNLANSVLNKATGAYDSAKNFGATKLSEAKAYASKGKEFIQSLPDWSKTKAQNANAMVKEKTGVDVWDTAKRAGNKVKTEITEKPEHLKNVYEKARSDAGDIAREGKRMAGEAVTSVKNAGKAAWDYAKPGGTFNQKYVQALEKIPGGSKIVSLANSAKTTADNLGESIADFARSNYRYATDSDYRNLTKEVKTAQKQLSSVQSQIAELQAESAKLGPTALPEGYNAIYALQEQEKALTSQINRANSVLDKYDED